MRHQAILNTHPTVVTISDDIGAFDSHGVPVTIDEALVKAEIVRLKAEQESRQYQRNRANEYPSVFEQLDMQYWDSVNGTTTWQDAINAVKAKYPKGA
jgi:hypothetical protein